MSYTKTGPNSRDMYMERFRIVGTKKIPLLDMDFLLWALGGINEVIEIRDSLGLDLTTLERDRLERCDEFSHGGVGFKIVFLNYRNSVYYPDIKIRFTQGNNWEVMLCEDIGKNETKEESILRVKTWFHDEVIPAYLVNLFS